MKWNQGGNGVKRGIILLLLIIDIFIMGGCGNYHNVTDSELAAKEERPIIITVLAGQSTSDAGIEDLIDEVLAEKFPNVELEWECVDWGEKFDSQMHARFAAGNVPDIMVGKAQDIYAYASSGNLAVIPVSCSSKIEEQALLAVTVDGVVYGIPYNVLYQGVIYDKNIFEQYDLKPPTTREELDKIVTILLENNMIPFATHFQESWKVGNMTMQFFMNDIFRDEPDWGEQLRKGIVNFSNNDNVEHCLKQNQYILNNSWSDALMIDQYESDRRFIQGEAAMYLTGSWSLQSINQYNTNQKYGIFPYPNQSGNSYLIRETNMTFMKSTTTEYGEIIDQIFQELITNEKLIQDILEFTQAYSTIKGVEQKYQSCIDEDINFYKDKNQVVEVTIGNNQLIWTFQNELAVKQQEWLQGNLELTDVLFFADKHRMESSN